MANVTLDLNLPDPQVITVEIVDDLKAALEQIEGIQNDLEERARFRDG